MKQKIAIFALGLLITGLFLPFLSQAQTATTTLDDPQVIASMLKQIEFIRSEIARLTALRNQGNQGRVLGTSVNISGDARPPLVRNVSITNITKNSATISWYTNENANATLWYSTSFLYDLSSAQVSSLNTTNYNTFHSFNLTGLNPNTTYFYMLRSVDPSNNTTTSSGLHTFTTLSN